MQQIRHLRSSTSTRVPCPGWLRMVQQAVVAVDDVLDDGEAEAGALLLAARLRIDPVEALGQPRHMLGRDADTMVGDRELRIEALAA